MHDGATPRPTFARTAKPDRLCRLASAQTDMTLEIVDVFGDTHNIQGQTGADGRLRVLTLPIEKVQISPDALEELAKLVRSIHVTVKEMP